MIGVVTEKLGKRASPPHQHQKDQDHFPQLDTLEASGCERTSADTVSKATQRPQFAMAAILGALEFENDQVSSPVKAQQIIWDM
jgi:hypothetical protein